jgi:hypothetical protein
MTGSKQQRKQKALNHQRLLMGGLFISNLVITPLCKGVGDLVETRCGAATVGRGITRWGPVAYRTLMFYYNTQHMNDRMEDHLSNMEQRLTRLEKGENGDGCVACRARRTQCKR